MLSNLARDSFLLPFAVSSALVGCALERDATRVEAPVSLSASAAALNKNSCKKHDLTLAPIGTYASGIFALGAAEIVTHDPSTQRLFVVNAAQASIDVLDIIDPTTPVLLDNIDLTAYGASVNSVDVRDGVLVAVVQATDKTDPGAAVFLDTTTLAVIAAVEVGALPDMVAWSPNGRFVLVANEGEPNNAYTVDPEGTVSVIDVSAGAASVTQASVRTADFHAFEGAALRAGVRVYGPGASVSQDIEPEYLTFSHDSRTAWVTLQENNALAVVDVLSATVTELLPLGTKDHSLAGNGLDASDRDSAINIANWPVHGLYLPDGIASFRAAGETFLVTANEGDLREYTGSPGFVEEARISALTLDPTAFPNAASLRNNARLGRLKVTRTLGDTDGDGDYDALYSIGARSFSIRATDGTLVYDSGDKLEQLTAAAMPANFNASHDDNAFDGRSDDKGPEPEGVTIGKVAGRTLALIGLERVGGVMVFDVSTPSAPCFVTYANNRNFAMAPNTAGALDLGPEGVTFVSEEDSPTGTPLVVVGNEISGTTTIYGVELD